MRPDNIDWDFQSDRRELERGASSAGRRNCADSYQPGVGTVNRDNYEADNPYSGYPELMTTRYGKYFMVFNTTRDEYGNKQTFDVELPADYREARYLTL